MPMHGASWALEAAMSPGFMTAVQTEEQAFIIVRQRRRVLKVQVALANL